MTKTNNVAGRFDISSDFWFEGGGEQWHFERAKISDSSELCEFFADRQIMAEYLPGAIPDSVASSQILATLSSWDDGKTCLLFSIIDSNEKIVALVSFDSLEDDNDQGEIGIALVSEAQRGRGLGKIFLHEALKFAFEVIGLNRVWARISPTNQASLRLFAKVGFVQEGVLRKCRKRDEEYGDLVLFSLLQNEWQALEERRISMERGL